MIVLDASATIEWLEQRSELAAAVEQRLLEADGIHVPHLWFVEVAQVLRRHVASGQLGAERGAQLLELAAQLPAHRHPHEPLAPRVWSLRANLTAYDAVYVALSEALDATLVTTDRAIAHTPVHGATVDLVE